MRACSRAYPELVEEFAPVSLGANLGTGCAEISPNARPLKSYFRATTACFAFASSGRPELPPSHVFTSTA
jgi:hypothetical protein